MGRRRGSRRRVASGLGFTTELSFLEATVKNSRPIVSAAVAIGAMLDMAAASAADLSLKSPSYPQPIPAFSWSGFYAGVNVGYGWGSNDWNSSGIFEDPTFTVGSVRPKTNGVLGGVQAGANYQIASWVFGVETDWAFMHGKGSFDSTFSSPVPGTINATITGTSQIEWLATFTGRAGYAWDRSLFYIKGGVAAAGYKDGLDLFTSQPSPPAFIDFGSKDNTLVGWIVAGGYEYAFSPRWSAKIEYNYVDLGKTSEKFNFAAIGGSITVMEDIHHTIQIVKVGANYRFGELP
jgi:outer membrane immunogenic protein